MTLATERAPLFQFKLFVADEAANSAQAIANLRALCRVHLPGRHEIEVVDVFLQPERALAESIFMTPTLMRLSPEPVRRIIGTLSETDLVLQTMGIGLDTVTP